MDFVCEICYENSEPTQYKCMCPEIKCCKDCIDKWIFAGNSKCPCCQTEIIGVGNTKLQQQQQQYGAWLAGGHNYDNLRLFSTTYNILRISSGMAGLSYSN